MDHRLTNRRVDGTDLRPPEISATNELAAVHEVSRLERSAQHYQVRLSPDEAVVRLDRWWIEQYVQGPVVLELGCADGVATEMLLDRAGRLDVVDGSPQYCAIVRDRLKNPKLEITNCLYQEFEPTRHYDDIVLARSLEMVADPLTLLTRVREWLGRDGRLHLVVQNAESLHRRIGYALGMLPSLDAVGETSALVGNRRLYTRSVLLQTLASAALTVRLVQGYFLKPFDSATLSGAPVDLATQLVPALYEVGKSVPDELCCFFYALCVPVT